jgi:hypothetical protein
VMRYALVHIQGGETLSSIADAHDFPACEMSFANLIMKSATSAREIVKPNNGKCPSQER